jgi:cysteine desulfurase/selenocysteine lyase
MDIKNQFPIFKTKPNLVYLDNAATTQKPEVVLNQIQQYYENRNANVHRGLYPLAEESTETYESSRLSVAKFLNVSKEEIIFTSGTTEGINLISDSLLRSNLVSSTDICVATELEHHSNLLPWRRIFNEITYLEVDTNGELKGDYLARLKELNPKVIAISHASNVTGVVHPIKAIREACPNAIIVLDIAQSIAHMKVDLKDLGVDAAAFSGHKLYGPMGIGALYVKKELLDRLEPFKVGGGMIREVKKDIITWEEGPAKFEAGTPNVEGAAGLAAAIKFVEDTGFEMISEIENELKFDLLLELRSIEGIQVFHSEDGIGVVSFYHNKVHPHDIAQYLGDNGICVRAGHHCTQMLHRDVFQVPATVRVSLGVYNSSQDIIRFAEVLHQAITFFQKSK